MKLDSQRTKILKAKAHVATFIIDYTKLMINTGLRYWPDPVSIIVAVNVIFF
jgi:hypothetical protein